MAENYDVIPLSAPNEDFRENQPGISARRRFSLWMSVSAILGALVLTAWFVSTSASGGVQQPEESATQEYDDDYMPGEPVEVRETSSHPLVRDSLTFAASFIRERIRNCTDVKALAEIRVLRATTQVVAGFSVKLDVHLVPAGGHDELPKNTLDVLWEPGTVSRQVKRFGMTPTGLQVFRSKARGRRTKLSWCELFRGRDEQESETKEEEAPCATTTPSAGPCATATPSAGQSKAGRRLTLKPSGYESPRCTGSEALPAEYDLRYHPTHSRCFDEEATTNQGSCGSCWSFAAKHTVTGRLCMQNYTDLHENPDGLGRRYVSPQSVLSCGADAYGYGCEGGHEMSAYEEWRRGGAPLERDYPYRGQSGGHPWHAQGVPCQWGYVAKPYKVLQYYFMPDGNLEEMKKELFCNGPFTVGYAVYENFGVLTNGVYDHIEGGFIGFHASAIVGYGTLNGVDYWEVLNSWGKEWGDQGYVKVKRGINLMGIESTGMSAPVVGRTEASWVYNGEFGQCKNQAGYAEALRGQGIKCVSHADLSVERDDLKCPHDPSGWPDKSVFPRDLSPDDTTFAEKPPVAKQSCVPPESDDCTAAKFCNGYGSAFDDKGECGCKCDEGFAGRNCDVCADGYEGFPQCRLSCLGSEECNGHGEASGVKWKNEFGQDLDNCECHCDPEHRGVRCETELHCPTPLNEDDASSGRCGPSFGRCNPKQADWALYCDEATNWCGDIVTVGTCPKEYPYAYSVRASSADSFEFCCSSADDCEGNVGIHAGRLGPDRGRCCAGPAWLCRSPPCTDYGDDKGDKFNYVTAGCLECADEEFCNGHGRAKLERGSCTCECAEGFSASNCEVCSAGYEGYPSCLKTCSDAGDCNGHGIASGVKWTDDAGKKQDSCECQCDPEHRGDHCEVELVCPVSLNSDATKIGRCGPSYGRCNAKQADWALYCNEHTGWCGNQITKSSCPEGSPYAYRPKAPFDYCCATQTDCHGNDFSGRLGPDRSDCCQGYHTPCSSPPCGDYGDVASDAFDYETSGCHEAAERETTTDKGKDVSTTMITTTVATTEETKVVSTTMITTIVATTEEAKVVSSTMITTTIAEEVPAACPAICRGGGPECQVGKDYIAAYPPMIDANKICYHACSRGGWCGVEAAHYNGGVDCCACAPPGLDFYAFSDKYVGSNSCKQAPSSTIPPPTPRPTPPLTLRPTHGPTEPPTPATPAPPPPTQSPPLPVPEGCPAVCQGGGSTCQVGPDYVSAYPTMTEANKICYHACSRGGWCGVEAAHYNGGVDCCACAPPGIDWYAFSQKYVGSNACEQAATTSSRPAPTVSPTQSPTALASTTTMEPTMSPTQSPTTAAPIPSGDLQYFDPIVGARCRADDLNGDSFGDLGSGISEKECLTRCSAKSGCKFVSYMTGGTSRSCTSFKGCTPPVFSPGYLTYEKK